MASGWLPCPARGAFVDPQKNASNTEIELRRMQIVGRKNRPAEQRVTRLRTALMRVSVGEGLRAHSSPLSSPESSGMLADLPSEPEALKPILGML